MLCKVEDSGELTKIQLARYPECGLFAQEIVGDGIQVRYLTPKVPLVPAHPDQDTVLEVPLEPDLGQLEKADINLHQSLVIAYRMGSRYDAWFSACFGFPTALIYIGDARRPILGTLAPKSSKEAQPSSNSWFSSITNYVTGSSTNQQDEDEEEDWITFSDCAPYLITTQASLNNVRARLSTSDVEMYKFRPNIVLDGDTHWDEDFWAELSINDAHTLTLTKMCNRCASLNVDYDTGRMADGERGTVLKKLMADRRVDAGSKYTPVFGRYGFLTSRRDGNGDGDNVAVSVGDRVEVARRNAERPVWDWSLTDPRVARYYHRS